MEYELNKEYFLKDTPYPQEDYDNVLIKYIDREDKLVEMTDFIHEGKAYHMFGPYGDEVVSFTLLPPRVPEVIDERLEQYSQNTSLPWNYDSTKDSFSCNTSKGYYTITSGTNPDPYERGSVWDAYVEIETISIRICYMMSSEECAMISAKRDFLDRGGDMREFRKMNLNLDLTEEEVIRLLFILETTGEPNSDRIYKVARDAYNNITKK